MDMWQKRVGYYDGGVCSIEVVAREGQGGEFFSCPEEGKVPRIKVGIDYPQWDRVMGVLCHEVMEFILASRGHRYLKAPDFAEDMGGFVFHFGHTDLSECARLLSLVLCGASVPLHAVYRSRRKQLARKGAK